jgi:serine/threonine protein kinase
MAPEQALGKATGHACDVYSLGIVAYEMVVGSTPFAADSPVALLMKQVNEPLPDPPDGTIPAGLLDIIRRAASKDPSHRWDSAGAFIAALETATRAEAQVPRAVRAIAVRFVHATRRWACWYNARQRKSRRSKSVSCARVTCSGVTSTTDRSCESSCWRPRWPRLAARSIRQRRSNPPPNHLRRTWFGDTTGGPAATIAVAAK